MAKKVTKATRTTTKRAVKATVAADIPTLTDQAKEYAADVDYKQLAMNALKIAVPLIVMKMIHNKYKTSKKSNWEKLAEPLFKEIKAKLKDM